MKRILLLSILSCSSLAYANNGYYASLKAGISHTKFDDSYTAFKYNDEGDHYEDKYENRNDDKTGYPNVSVAFGYDFSAISKLNLRTELEYTYKDSVTFNPDFSRFEYSGPGYHEYENIPEGESSFFNNEIKTQLLMLNSYYDFKNKSKFTPYVSAGIGFARIKYSRTGANEYYYWYPELNNSNSRNNFAWSAGVGVAYSVTDNVALDLAYRYLDMGKAEIEQTEYNTIVESKADITSHDFSFGVRYTF